MAGGNSGHPEEEDYLARGMMGDAHLLPGAVPEGKQEEGAMRPLLGAFSLRPPVLAQAGTPESLFAVGFSSLLLPMALLIWWN